MPSDTDQCYLDFWRQLPTVTQVLRPDQTLSWGIALASPPAAPTPSPTPSLHADWIISVSLCALLDQHVSLSQGLSFVIPALPPWPTSPGEPLA